MPGPIEASVVTVVDGDTLEVEARIWLGQDVRIRVRIDGIDSPELRGKCARERQLAIAARRRLTDLVGNEPVSLTTVRYGKYAGRVVAAVASSNGVDMAAALIAGGFARPYDGGRRAPWCDGEEAAASP